MAAEPTSPPPPAPAPVTTQPFVVRGDGKRLEMPGSTLNDKGDLTVAAEHVSTYRQLIAEGLAHRGSWRQKEQALQQQIKEASAVEAAQKEKYHRASVLLFEKVTDPQWLQMAVADPREVQYLIRDLQLEIKAADMGAPKAPTPQPAVPDEENPQILEAANAVFVDYLEELLEGPQARTVFASEEDRKALRAELEALAGTFFVKREDGWALSEEAMEKAFTKELRLKQHERQQQLAAKKAEEFNAKRNQPPVAAPPVVSTKGPGVTGPPTQKQYASKEEYYKAMGLS